MPFIKYTPPEKIVDKLDAEIMEWFYECVKINFGVDIVQDSTDLREILEEALLTHTQAVEERMKDILQNLKFNWEEKALGDMIVVKILQALNKPND